MKEMTIDDISRVVCANNIHFSPEGLHFAYVTITPDVKNNTYKNDIVCVNTNTLRVRKLTHTGRCGDFIFDDENTLLFTTCRQDEDEAKKTEEKTSFYRLRLDGGEAEFCFRIGANVTGYKKIGDHRYILRILIDKNRPDPKEVSQEICEEELDYHIFEEVPFWGNGRGYVSGKRSILYLYDETKQELQQLTGKDTNVSWFDVQGDKVAYIARTYTDIIPVCSELYVIDLETNLETVIVEENTLRVDAALFTDTGMIFAASDMHTWGNGQLADLYRYDFENHTYTKIFQNTAYALGDTPLIDTMRPAGNCLFRNGEDLYFTALVHNHTDLYHVLSDNSVEVVLGLNGGAISALDMHENTVCFIGSEPASLNKVYFGHNNEETYTVVDDLNPWVKDVFVSEAEYIPFTNSTGIRIDGWALKPKDHDPSKKYPAILEIHGGPRAAYGTMAYHEMQIWASKGYYVFFCNPRGSEGYGESFADLRGRYGTIDYRDLMEFTDHVLAQYPDIDKDRLGVSGGSYGGFMCNWIEGHTDRFAAIASQRSISNWVADFGSSEIGVNFDGNELAATPWTDMEKMWKQSPLKYASNAKTPILFIHSLCDYNCTIDQGVEMFTAMKYFGVPSRMVVFEGENHGLSRSGKPKHRMRRLKEMTDWFEKYLKF